MPSRAAGEQVRRFACLGLSHRQFGDDGLNRGPLPAPGRYRCRRGSRRACAFRRREPGLRHGSSSNFCSAHARARQHALYAAHRQVAGDHHHLVDPAPRHWSRTEAGCRGRRVGAPAIAVAHRGTRWHQCPDQRMDDRLSKLLQRPPRTAPVHGGTASARSTTPLLHRAPGRQLRSTGATASPAVEIDAPPRIGIVNRNAKIVREHFRRRRLAHADRPGQAENDHVSARPGRRR
jgi:hypothetical protein